MTTEWNKDKNGMWQAEWPGGTEVKTGEVWSKWVARSLRGPAKLGETKTEAVDKLFGSGNYVLQLREATELREVWDIILSSNQTMGTVRRYRQNV